MPEATLSNTTISEMSRGLTVFAQDWCHAFSRVCEMVTGTKPELSWSGDESPAAPVPGDIEGHFWWNHVIAGEAAQYPVWIQTPRRTWSKIVASLELPDDEQGQQAFSDILSQALMAVAQEIAGRKRIKLTVPSAQAAGSSQPEDLAFRTIQIELGEEHLPDIIVGVDSGFASELQAEEQPPADEEVQGPPNPLFERLIDLELPVSVVLGRATLPIREILKITPGSLIELGHQVGDPVELVVENAVVARGEVVAVRGNYGVRIHQLISRQERMMLHSSTSQPTAGAGARN